MTYRFYLIFYFLFFAIICQSQKDIHINESVSYKKLKSIPVSDISSNFLFYPNKGYFDLNSFSPVLQYSIPSGYELTVFNYDEEKLSLQETNFFLKTKVSDIYNVETRVQQQNAFNKNKIILISCFRKHNGDIYKLKSVNIRLEPESKSIKSFKKTKNFTANSTLSDGSSWHKLRNFKKGIHKIDYNFLINNNIIDNDIPSKNIHLYSNNVGLLGSVNNDQRPDDLIQQTIFINDGGDGVFSNGDYLLFYLNSANREQWNNGKFTHVNHLYSDSAYFFLNIQNRTVNHLDTINNLNQSFSQEITSFKDFKYIEEDKVNLLKSGSQWLGDVFDIENNKNYSFSFNNIGDSSHVSIKVVGKSNFSPSYFNLSLFGQASDPIQINSTGSSYYSPVGRKVLKNFDFINLPGQPFVINLNYDNNGSPSSKGYLDYIEVNCDRELYVDNQQFSFFIPAISSTENWAKIILSNSDNVDMVWDITDLTNIKDVEFTKNGSDLYLISKLDSNRHFIAISGSNFETPSYFKFVSPQNLHGLPTPEMIIITPFEFKLAADELKLIHQDEAMNVIVVTDEEIYNEFSGGIPDATAIKQFLRMFYVRENENPTTIPKYCLLFGDGTYDNKNKLGHGKNFLPVYESIESLIVTNTYATDDYYAILSDGASMRNTDLLNIAIGRLVVANNQQANEMVDKIRNYVSKNDSSIISVNCVNNNSKSNMGEWRNKLVMVSDDEDQDAYFNDIEIMASKVEIQKPEMNIIKIHSDAYSQQSTPVGERIPDVSSEIEKKVNDGALVVNYIGHGGEAGWAHEKILDIPTIRGWNNISNMPVFMTATCEFGRFDDHDRISAGEYILLNPKGAGIGLFTTTRLVYAIPNEYLNKYFYDTVFDYVNYKSQRLGDIYVGTKNKYAINNADPNFRKFAYLGDPALKLALPEQKVKIDSFNRDTVSALSEVIVYGHIEDVFGNKLSSFNGKASLTFYDKKSSFTTLGTNSGSSISPFEMWKNIIYKGKSSVSKGDFSFTFKVPKDISYSYGFSRMSLYAENGNIDAAGYNDSLIIGGIDTTAAIDEIGPDVQMYLNDESFVSGGISNNNPLLIVSVFDSNGINTVGNGIGHNIELVVDDDFTNSIILNDYYESDLDTYKSGKINYELSDLSEGDHKLKIKVWDNYNNSTDSELFFTVINEQDIEISHVLNYPNPFTTNTSFYFEHNQNCNYLDVSIQIYTVSGRVVKRINKRIHNEGFRSQGVAWDGTDDYGEQLSRGVYLYNLSVKNEQGLSADKTEAMFLLK